MIISVIMLLNFFHKFMEKKERTREKFVLNKLWNRNAFRCILEKFGIRINVLIYSVPIKQ